LKLGALNLIDIELVATRSVKAVLKCMVLGGFDNYKIVYSQKFEADPPSAL
jgi:hypothetical protein